MSNKVKAKEAKAKPIKKLMQPSEGAFKTNYTEKPRKITKEDIKRYLPRGSAMSVSDEIVELMNRAGEDTGLPQELMSEEILSYMPILNSFKSGDLRTYLNAVKYCNLKRVYSNSKAWSIVFPDRYQKLIDDGKKDDISAHVAMYNASALVKAIDKEMLIPFYLQYQPYAHAAIKKQFQLMNGKGGVNNRGEPMTVTPMVQHLAAKALFDMVKPPEEMVLDIQVNKSDEELDLQRELTEQLKEMVKQQKERLDAGEDITKVQKLGISVNAIDAEIEE